MKKSPDVSTAQCPCMSGRNYDQCCRVIHLDQPSALQPEQLMRARYSAYVLGKEDFILSSWAFETRPKELFINHRTQWLALKDVIPEPVSAKTNNAAVSFTTIYLEENMLHTLQERSTFIMRSTGWYYLNGEGQLETRQLSGSASCPCGSGMKLKRCCLQRR